MFGLLFGGRRRSPALFYLRLLLLAALLIAVFVLHASAADLVYMRIARIAVVVLLVLGMRFARPLRRGSWQGRRSPRIDASAGDASRLPSDDGQ